MALWDFDHDGDLDIVINAMTVYRTALEESDAGVSISFSQVPLPAHDGAGVSTSATRALILDVDDDHDTDLLFLTPQGNYWFDNLRELKFKVRALPAGKTIGVFDVVEPSE